MFLSNNSSTLSEMQLAVTIEQGDQHNVEDLVDDTLDAEIDRLETSINMLEATHNDLPDCSMYELEEGEIVDSPPSFDGDKMFCTNNDFDDDTDGEITDSDSDTDNSVMKTVITIDSVRSPDTAKSFPFQECVKQHEVQETDIPLSSVSGFPREKMQNFVKPLNMFIKFSNDTSVKSKDCTLHTNIKKMNELDMVPSDKSNCNDNIKTTSTCVITCTNSTVTNTLSSEKLNCKDMKEVCDDSFLQINVSQETENELLGIGDDDDDGDSITGSLTDLEESSELISSTPCRIQDGDLKMWKPKFLSHQGSFLVLDEYGDSSDLDQSIYSSATSPIRDTPVGNVRSVIIKPKELCFEKSESIDLDRKMKTDISNVGQRCVAFGKDGELRIQSTTIKKDDISVQNGKFLFPTKNIAFKNVCDNISTGNRLECKPIINCGQTSFDTKMEFPAITRIEKTEQVVENTKPNCLPGAAIPKNFEVDENRNIAMTDEDSTDRELRKIAFGKDGGLKVLVEVHTKQTVDVNLQDSSQKKSEQTLSSAPAVQDGNITSAIDIEGTSIPVLENKHVVNVIELETRNSVSSVNVLANKMNTEAEDTERKATASSVENNVDKKPTEDVVFICEVSSKSTDHKLLEQKIKTSKHDENYISNNPQENADNNNPEWELLRKLETDVERYRAMRERWRNLVIPDPNQDLTYRNWRIHHIASKSTESNSATCNEIKAEVPIQNTSKSQSSSSTQRNCHKRARTEESSSTFGPEVKRPRTQSCTAVYDVKLQKLRENILNEKQRISGEEHLALLQLNLRQTQEMENLRNYCHSYSRDHEMNDLLSRQLRDVERVQRRYDDARRAIDVANQNQVQILEKACEEVRAFHLFYRGLDHKSDAGDTFYLSDSQLEELWETERLYEQYKIFYSS